MNGERERAAPRNPHNASRSRAPEGVPRAADVGSSSSALALDRERLALVPDPLSIDPSTQLLARRHALTSGTAPHFAPPVPGLSSLHELNVRTYVHLDGVPGVWFFSLDANNRAAVASARTFYHLPYFHAEIALEQEGETINYDLARTDDPPAEFHASWKIGGNPRFAHPDTLEFFLVERYCLYATRGDRLLRARIHHEPWPLQDAALKSLDSTMLESHGLPTPAGEPCSTTPKRSTWTSGGRRKSED